MKFSVLMSVYDKENPKYFSEALDSTLVNQSVIPDELVIVKDGPLTKQLDEVIEKYQERFTSLIKVIKLETNMGLGEALRVGLEECNFDIVARMDSDDINNNLRFEKQLKLLLECSEVDLVGSNIAEFFYTTEDIKFIRKVPTTSYEIRKMARRRNPINHVSVMFRKSSVMKVGGYKHLPFLEDYYLWIRMIGSNFNLMNINEELVYVRTGEKMFTRRSNPEYIKGWYNLQKEMVNNKIINQGDVIINMLNILGFIYTPAALKKYIYRYFLRNTSSIYKG